MRGTLALQELVRARMLTDARRVSASSAAAAVDLYELTYQAIKPRAGGDGLRQFLELMRGRAEDRGDARSEQRRDDNHDQRDHAEENGVLGHGLAALETQAPDQ